MRLGVPAARIPAIRGTGLVERVCEREEGGKNRFNQSGGSNKQLEFTTLGPITRAIQRSASASFGDPQSNIKGKRLGQMTL